MASTSTRRQSQALADLIESLGTSAEGKLFVRDVVEEYPHFAEAYVRMCPERTDLTAMRKKALDGQYGMSAEAVLRDINLLVDNCCRFNGGPQSEFGIKAIRFQNMAKAAISKHFAPLTTSPAVVAPTQNATPSDPQASGSRHHQLSLRPKRGRADDDSSAVAAAAGPPAPFTSAQLLQFIASLERPEDEELFSHDAVKMFPWIAVDYDKVCPVRMDLDRMRAKARTSGYSTAEALRRDIALIEANCVTYNGVGTPLALRAEGFRRHAEHCLTRFLEHPAEFQAASGQTGKHRAPPSSSLQRGGATSAAPTRSVSSSHQDVVPVVPPPREKEYVTPNVRPLSFQLPLHIPPKIRSRMLTAHLQKDTWTCKMLPTSGHRCSADAVVSAFLQALRQQVDGLERDAAEQIAEARGPGTKDGAVKHADGTPLKKEPDQSTASDGVAAPQALPPPQSESALRRATLALATAAKRREHATHCADVMRILVQLFNDVFLHALLYPAERCTVDAWVAKRTCSSFADEGEELLMRKGVSFVWSSVVHVEYLIRLAVHLPQLGCLAAAQSAQPAAPLGSGTAPTVGGTALSTHQLKEITINGSTQHLVASTLPPIEAFLCFVEAHYASLFHSDGV